MEISPVLIEKLANARSVAILTGAGVSAESGIKTFRDPDGLWAKLSPQELASIDGFMRNPETVWSWYNQRREVVASCEPNTGHFAIAEMQSLFPKFTLITQNVDRLHQRAGSTDVVELHGNLVENRCFECSTPYTEEIDLKQKSLPVCPKCGGKIRPSVVWFGEMLPEDAIARADQAVRSCDVFFTIGTSAAVYPAAALPTRAKDYGAYVVEVNPNETEISRYLDCTVRAGSASAMPEIVAQLKSYTKK